MTSTGRCFDKMNTSNKVFFLSCAYLGTLFVSLVVLWWSVLIGPSPIVSGQSHTEGNGYLPGEIAVVSHTICTRMRISVDIFSSLNSKDSGWYPLFFGVKSLTNGCQETRHQFVVPNLPPGEYKYTAKIKYQTNLVGRDDMIDLSTVTIRIQ